MLEQLPLCVQCTRVSVAQSAARRDKAPVCPACLSGAPDTRERVLRLADQAARQFDRLDELPSAEIEACPLHGLPVERWRVVHQETSHQSSLYFVLSDRGRTAAVRASGEEHYRRVARHWAAEGRGEDEPMIVRGLGLLERGLGRAVGRAVSAA